jgi:hypothetical protein
VSESFRGSLFSVGGAAEARHWHRDAMPTHLHWHALGNLKDSDASGLKLINAQLESDHSSLKGPKLRVRKSAAPELRGLKFKFGDARRAAPIRVTVPGSQVPGPRVSLATNVTRDQPIWILGRL